MLGVIPLLKMAVTMMKWTLIISCVKNIASDRNIVDIYLVQIEPSNEYKVNTNFLKLLSTNKLSWRLDFSNSHVNISP